MGNRGISLPFYLSLSLFLKAALVPVPSECCTGAPASENSSLMAAVDIQDGEVAGMASRINCKLKNL